MDKSGSNFGRRTRQVEYNQGNNSLQKGNESTGQRFQNNLNKRNMKMNDKDAEK